MASRLRLVRLLHNTAIVAALAEEAERLGRVAEGSEWFLFGSVARDEVTAADVDLMILCVDAAQADAIRAGLDGADLPLPLHLSMMTFDEEASCGAVALQKGSRILTVQLDRAS